MKFVQQLEAATPVVCQLLGSKTVSDVLEAINFFVTCHEFGISAAHEGVKKMLVLIWSRETSVRDAVTVAYKRLYLTQSVEGQRFDVLCCVAVLTDNVTAYSSTCVFAHLLFHLPV